MDMSRVKATLAAVLFFCLPIILSVYAWARSAYFSLPLPMSVSAISAFYPIISAVVIPLAARTLKNRYNNAALFGTVTYILTLIPIVLLILALIYSVPSQLLSCSLESQWGHLFRTKNVGAVRAIQDSLRCCGLNSMHDRAWPFPSKGVKATECERTQGWKVRCLDGWTEQETRIAGLVAVASVVNWAFVILLAYMARNRLFWTGRPDRRAIGARLPGRLLENEEAAAVDERQQRIADSGTYTDDPDGDTVRQSREGAADDEETNGAHATVRTSPLYT